MVAALVVTEMLLMPEIVGVPDELFTVIVTAGLTPVLPAASMAMADSTCDALPAVVVSQDTL